MITLDTPEAVATMTGIRLQSISIREGKDDSQRQIVITAQGIDSNGDFTPGPPYVLEVSATGAVATRGAFRNVVPGITFTFLFNGAAPNGFRRRCVNALRVAFSLQGTEA